MMNIKIYQINREQDYDKVQFMSMDFLLQLYGHQDIDSSIYDRVFSGKVDCETLEDVYVMFNTNHPFGYHGRSLSVSDVVEVVLPDEDSVFYFCDSIGFRNVDFNPDECGIDSKEIAKEEISALLIEPQRPPETIIIDPELKSFQRIVGGHVEIYQPFEDDVVIICNEEGKANRMPPNRAIYENEKCGLCCRNRKIADIIHGNFLVVYAPEESEEFASLPKDLIEKYTKRFLYPEAFLCIGDNLLAFSIKPAPDRNER